LIALGRARFASSVDASDVRSGVRRAAMCASMARALESRRRSESRAARPFAARRERALMSKSRIEPSFPADASDGQLAMLRMIAAELPGIVFAVDREGTILLEEGRGTGILGRPSEHVIGRSVFDVFRDAPEVCASVRRALAGEEFMVALPLGGGVSEVRYAPVRSGGPDSPVVGVIGISHDVTEMRRTQQDLLASQMMYKSVIDTTDTGYVVADMQGRVLDANAEYVRLSGYDDLDAIRGRSVLEWTAAYDVERNRREVEKCVAHGRVRNLEIDYTDRRGQITPIEINATYIPLKKGGRILCLCRDVSERRRAEESLRRSELMNRAILDSMRAGIAVLDARGRITQVNSGWDRLRRENGLADHGAAQPGDDYLEVCRRAAADGCEDAARCFDGLRAVLSGELEQFDLDYECDAPANPRRFHLRAVPMPRPPGGLVVAHLEAADAGASRSAAAHRREP
jgi:PAS domain S-box-containing protein